MPEQGYKRWYDVDLHLSNMVRTMELMTGQNRQLFGHLICMLCENRIEAEPEVRKTDWEHLQGLIKSKRGRRWYDEDPVMHKAMNLLYTLTETTKIQIARQLVDVTGLVHDYELFCLKNDRTAEIDIVQTIIAKGIQDGAEEAEGYLRTVCV